MRILTLLLIVAGQACLAGSIVETMSTGEWSDSTNGLRGRLLYAVQTNHFGAAIECDVYLELQNVALGDSMYVRYSYGASQLRCDLRDSNNNTVKTKQGAGSDWMPSSCWLALPNDSTLRFRTGSTSSMPDYPCYFITSGWVGGKWEIPITATNDYYLSGIFTSSSSTNETRPRVWEGALKLPPVNISVKKIQ